MITKTFCRLVILLCILPALNVSAQVTIGSVEKPIIGALLDLKENQDGTSSKGLGLPRVKLSDLNPTTPAGLAASIGDTGRWELDEHTAMLVYNSYSDQCAAKPIEEGIYVWDGKQWKHLGKKGATGNIVASPAETSQPGNPWGTNVVLHQKKLDVNNEVIYENFYSADFGEAGRWMTTNLAAYQYDGAIYTGGDPEGKPNVISGTFNQMSYEEAGSLGMTRAWYAYPTVAYYENDTVSPTEEFLLNPYMGLVYTFDAASAGKKGEDGWGNVDLPEGATLPYYEAGLPEWDGTGVRPSKTQKRRQGICPKGWHLPSDYEWTELEQEIIRNTSKYTTDMADINHADPTDPAAQIPVVQPDPGSSTDQSHGWRGTTHGVAMMSICNMPNVDLYISGKSLPSGKNGFNNFFTGNCHPGSSGGYGFENNLWTSSIHYGSYTWIRGFYSPFKGVNRNTVSSGGLLQAVRCKKDN